MPTTPKTHPSLESKLASLYDEPLSLAEMEAIGQRLMDFVGVLLEIGNDRKAAHDEPLPSTNHHRSALNLHPTPTRAVRPRKGRSK